MKNLTKKLSIINAYIIWSFVQLSNSRMLMLLTDEESIREVIAFPMNSKAQDLLMKAPGIVSQKQLDEVHIKISK